MALKSLSLTQDAAWSIDWSVRKLKILQEKWNGKSKPVGQHYGRRGRISSVINLKARVSSYVDTNARLLRGGLAN